MGSLIRFDYAAVNDTAPSVVAPTASGAGGPTTTTLTSTPSAVPSPSGSGSGSAVSSRSALGPIVGGTVGGIVVIAAMILALIFCRRKRKQGPLQPMYFESRPSPSHAPTAAALYTSHFPSSPQMVEPFPYAPSSGSSALLSPPSSAFVVSSASTEALSEDASQRYTAAAAPARPSKRTQSAGTSSPAPRVLPTSPPPPALDGLTEEQAIFINNLRSANVPAAEIGGLMEIMRRERAGSLGGGGAQAAVDAPPRYDFKSPA